MKLAHKIMYSGGFVKLATGGLAGTTVKSSGIWVSAILFILLFSGIANAAWTIEQLDGAKTYSDFFQRSIAIDKVNNQPHIVYGEDRLYHAYFDGTRWYYEYIDMGPGVGRFASIAIDSNNKVHISYYDATNADLKYATNQSGTWENMTLDSDGDVGQYSSIAVDQNNKVHISYYDVTNQVLKYSSNATSSWVSGVVDSSVGTGTFCSIAANAGGAHISYYDATNKTLKYATGQPGTWMISTINYASTDYGQYSSIALDAAGFVHVSFFENISATDTPETNFNLRYATNKNGDWVVESVDDAGWVGWWTSIAVDTNGFAHISYYDYSNYNLKYANNTTGVWVPEIAEAALDSGWWSALALDSNGKAYISYLDKTNNVVKYTMNVSGHWVGELIDSSSTFQYGVSSLVDSNNKMHIFYLDRDNNLRYVTNQTAIWSSSKLAEMLGLGVGTYRALSAIIDKQDNIHLCYFTPDRILKYLSNVGGEWNEIALSAPDINYNVSCSITLDINNNLYIAYKSASNLLILSTQTGVWTNIFSGVIYPNYPDISIGGDLSIHVVYGCFLGLCHLTDATGLWTEEVVTSESQDAMEHPFFVDANNRMHIGYTPAHMIKYAYNSQGPNWIIDTLTASNFWTRLYSIFSDKSGKSHIIYWDNDSLIYTNNATGVWTPELVTNGLYAYGVSAGLDSADNVQIAAISENYSKLLYITSGDKVPPTGTISINSGATLTNSPSVTLSLTCDDGNGSGCSHMRFSNDAVNWSDPEPVADTRYAWLLSDNDGHKTVWVKFKDAAGNWSQPFSRKIRLDSTAPLTTSTPAGGIYPYGWMIELSCVDGAGVGCDKTYYTTNGIAPDTNSTLYTGAIPIGTDTTLKFFSIDKIGNPEQIRTEVYQFDTVKPTVALTSPLDGDILEHLFSITGTASDNLSGVAKVELQITDGSNYLNAANMFVPAPGWVPAVGTTDWSFNSSAVNWLNNATYTITARATDSVGNVSAAVSRTFTKLAAVEQAFTTLSLDLSSQTILQNGSISAAGKLTRLPDNGTDLFGKGITLTVKGPDNSTHSISATTYDQFGHYKAEDISGFTLKGTYTITAGFAGTPVLASTTSPAQAVLVGASAGYAIIVEGKIGNEEGLESHNKTANRIYKSLRERGFAEENIYYFNYDDTQTGVDDVPSKDAIQYSIETWARFRMNGSPAPLYIIMVDHGNPDTFFLNDETITPADLNTWLSTLEGYLSNAAKKEKRIVILGSCYSGSFISALSKSGRVIVSSAAADEESYKGPNEPDGIRGGEFFLEEFFQELKQGKSLKKSFEAARERTATYTRRGGDSINSYNSYHDNVMQHPLLDDNADGKGSNTLDEADGDGDVAAVLFMGAGVSYDANSLSNPADITQVTDTIFLDAATQAASLWAKANFDNEVSSAWLEVRHPSIVLAAQGGSNQLEVNIPKEFLSLNDLNHSWEATYGLFTESGMYEIYYFVRDKTTLEPSPMKRSVVYKNSVDNLPPSAFALTSPADGTEQKTSLILDWEDSFDADGVTYTVLFSKDSSFTSIAYRREELLQSMTSIGPEAHLSDLTTYYWKVQAIDKYGAITESSQTWSFATDNTNGVIPIIMGRITDSASGAGVSGAVITASTGGEGISQSPTGEYFASVTPGTLNLTITADGYVTKTVNGLFVSTGDYLTQNVSLTPTVVPRHALSVTKTGNGVVSAANLSWSGNTGTGQYIEESAVLLTAIPAQNWSFSGWSGDCSGTATQITVTMSSDRTCAATFTLKQYYLTVQAGTGQGTVGGSGWYSYGQTATVNAYPQTGYTLSGWSGNCSGTDVQTTVYMDTTKACTADFIVKPPLQYSLTLQKIGAGSISGAGTYNYGTTVPVTAAAGSGYIFKNWSGDCSGSTPSLNIYMDRNKTCTATFVLRQYSMTVTTGGTGTGRVSGEGLYSSGSNALVTAVPDANATFTAWSGDCTGAIPTVQIPMTSNRSCTANFGSAPIANPVKRLAADEVYADLQSALDQVSADEEIRITSGRYLFNQVVSNANCDNRSIVLSGGNTSGFAPVAGAYTLISGSLTVQSGTVILDKIIIQQ